MNKTKTVKIVIDVLMTICLFVLMCYQYIGKANHEIAGTMLLVLFVLHHILNRNWYKNLKKGSYNSVRILQTSVNFLLLVVMLLQGISGISMSSHVFPFIKMGMSSSTARSIHMVFGYFGFLLMSFHIGLHFNVILMRISKPSVDKKTSKIAGRGVAGALAVYGVVALIKRDLISYITMQTSFAFFDYEEPVLFFIFDYFAIMGLMVFLAYYLQRFLIKSRIRENREEDV